MNVHGQEVPQVEKRADHFNFTNHYHVGVLTVTEGMAGSTGENRMLTRRTF